MEYEQTFRFILILGFSVIVPIAAYHRIKSQATGEKLDRRQEGIFILVTLRPIGMASMVGLVTYMINPALMTWSSVALPNWLRWAGVVLGDHWRTAFGGDVPNPWQELERTRS